MSDVTERDPEVLSEVLRRRVLRAMVPVVRKLARAARGHPVFGDDHERQACVALARLVPALVPRPEPEHDYGPGYHPNHTPEQAARLLAKLQATRAAWDRGERRDGGNNAKDQDNKQPVEES